MARQKVSTTQNPRFSITGGTDKAGKPLPTTIEGYFLGTKLFPDQFNPGKNTQIHVFQTAAGEQEIYGKTMLNSALSKVPHGTFVWIKYLGRAKTSKPGRSPAHEFSVDQDPEDRIEVSPLAVDSVPYAEDDGVSYEENDEQSGVTNGPAYGGDSGAAERRAKVEALLGKNKGNKKLA